MGNVLAELTELAARVVHVADAAFGPFPVQSPADAMTAIEEGIFALRLQLGVRPPIPPLVERFGCPDCGRPAAEASIVQRPGGPGPCVNPCHADAFAGLQANVPEITRLSNEVVRLRARLAVIRDSNRHAAFCSFSRNKRTPAGCSPGCPVLIARQALAD